ncbi:HaeIII family restriction endonuclease [Anabaena catenula]|uniref:HaeIII family restriction endonuclease n=1 Tax=Anabaena catenula FACHB-362 TaxID=2692877 RepID=A0ABR8JFJ5_9NOST|nr:HaeIII family restriction endonuclease [Anabaena catenula]MBD2695201.1 HaeIII family restriction endonuclease [Anabaena catenula FACHB-362]
MTPRSNLHGRVLEYLITEVLIRNHPGVSLTNRANNDQVRDASKLADLNPALLNELTLAANALLLKWLNPHFQLSDQASITIDRLPDQNKKDVTDICLTSRSWTVNLSLKHNHSALRHQRPGTTPIHCGYSKDSAQMQQFKQQYQVITQELKQHIGQANLFKELPSALIEQYLYTPVCNLVSQFITSHASTCTTHLFQYLVGDVNYYKIIVDTHAQTLSIQKFADIQMPTNVIATVNRQYVNLSFDNGWEISMRLHTASSQLKNSPSLKFDTKALNNPLTATIIPYV